MSSGIDTRTRLRQFGSALVKTLSSQVNSEGQLIDPGTGEPVPDDHYANMCFAVAGFREAARTDSENYRRKAKQSLDYFLSLDSEERGHSEFNSWALIELIRDVRAGRYNLPVTESRLLEAIQFDSRIDSQEGNNWLLLRGLCHLRLANLFGQSQDERAFRRICQVFRYWIQEDGVMADAPRFPLAPIESPMTYHAKLATLCAHIGTEADNQSFTRTALDAFNVLHSIALPTGESFYFGRSENTLFGYVTALDGVLHIDAEEEWLFELRDQLASYLLENFDPMLGACQPGGRAGVSIDDYVYDGIYSSYAAMVLLDLPITSDRNVNVSSGDALASIQTAGLLSATGEESALGLAQEGQIKFTKGIPDPRYAGLMPLSFTFEGKDVCPGVPFALFEEGFGPYQPIAIHGQDRFVPVVWSRNYVRQEATLTVTGQGFFYPTNRTEDVSNQSVNTDGYVTSLLKGVMRPIAEKAKIPLIRERNRKQPAILPVSIRRAIHYLLEEDVLVIQTGTVSSKNWQILPTSCVLSPDFESAVALEFKDQHISTETKQVNTHKGPGLWIHPTETSGNRQHWSSIVLDPGEATSRINNSSRGGALITECRTGESSRNLKLDLPSSPFEGQ